jgi:hypothetical protein
MKIRQKMEEEGSAKNLSSSPTPAWLPAASAEDITLNNLAWTGRTYTFVEDPVSSSNASHERQTQALSALLRLEVAIELRELIHPGFMYIDADSYCDVALHNIPPLTLREDILFYLESEFDRIVKNLILGWDVGRY